MGEKKKRKYVPYTFTKYLRDIRKDVKEMLGLYKTEKDMREGFPEEEI